MKKRAKPKMKNSNALDEIGQLRKVTENCGIRYLVCGTLSNKACNNQDVIKCNKENFLLEYY